MSEIININIGKINLPDNDGRLEIDTEADQELIDSIKVMGVLEPLIVRKKNKRIEIIAGSSRYRCSKIAGLDSVPCIMVKADALLAEKIKLHENLKRRDLSHIDQGFTFARLHTELHLTENQISEIVGKSIPYISQHIKLITSGEVLVSAVQDGSISFSVARELMQVENKTDRDHLLEFAIKGGATVQTVKDWVNTASYERSHLTNDKPLTITTDKYVPESLPTFTCEACDHNHVIKEMVVRRLCPECDFIIFDEIRKEKAKLIPQNQTGLSETPQETIISTPGE